MLKTLSPAKGVSSVRQRRAVSKGRESERYQQHQGGGVLNTDHGVCHQVGPATFLAQVHDRRRAWTTEGAAIEASFQTCPAPDCYATIARMIFLNRDLCSQTASLSVASCLLHGTVYLLICIVMHASSTTFPELTGRIENPLLQAPLHPVHSSLVSLAAFNCIYMFSRLPFLTHFKLFKSKHSD